MAQDCVVIIVVCEDQGWSAGSPHLGSDFVVSGASREEVVAKVKTLLNPLVDHGFRYRFLGPEPDAS